MKALILPRGLARPPCASAHDWNVTAPEAVAIQERLRGCVETADRLPETTRQAHRLASGG